MSQSHTRKSYSAFATKQDFIDDLNRLRREPEWLVGRERWELIDEAKWIGLDVSDLES